MPSVSFANALQDNYIWFLISDNRRHVAAIDPGQAEPVRQFLQRHHVQLSAILITHHHHDHIGGVEELVKQYQCPVYGLPRPEMPWITHPVNSQKPLILDEFSLALTVLNVPGHTNDHIAYYCHPYLFPGDTIFTGGCGRLFEGTAEQLYESLMTIARLPDDIRVYCAHEYTLNNLKFALWIEPDNQAIKERLAQVKRLREQKLPTVPSSMSIEKQTNPFLRCHLANVRKRVAELSKQSLSNPIATFTQLRKLKDQWQPT